jgi:hypothetical protein
MKLALTIGAWIVSLGALAAAALTGYLALYTGQLLFWLGVAAGVVFAVVANPLTARRLGLAGAWGKTLGIQALLVLIGIGSLFGGFQMHSARQLQLSEESARQAQEDYINGELRAAAALGVQRAKGALENALRNAQPSEATANGWSAARIEAFDVPEPDGGWRATLQAVGEAFTIERATACVEMFGDLIYYSSVGDARYPAPTAFAFERHSSGGYQLPENAWLIPNVEQLAYGAAFWSGAKFEIALRVHGIDGAAGAVYESDELREQNQLIGDELLAQMSVRVADATLADMSAEYAGTARWHHLEEGEFDCLAAAGITPQPVCAALAFEAGAG